MKFKKPNILDCTLRDGSYVNNFKFTKKDTKIVCEKLEKSGINFIEVGHGIGLGASKKTQYKAFEKDETYIKSARSVIKKSKLGVFAIPGLANLDDIIKARDCGIDFIRIGIDILDYKNAFDFIKLSKKLNLFTCINFMKSYVTSPKNFANISNSTFNLGTDITYIVDSAGGMNSEQIKLFAKAIFKKNKKIKLGFHGHNNTGMALQNSLLAYELNFALIDSSLQGLGRSAGNASTEMLAFHFNKKNKNNKYNYLSLIEFSEKKIRPISDNGFTSIDMLCGETMFHSSYLPVIEKFSKIYKIDPRKIIKEITKITKVEAPEELVRKICIKLKKSKANKGNWKKIYNHFYVNEQSL